MERNSIVQLRRAEREGDFVVERVRGSNRISLTDEQGMRTIVVTRGRPSPDGADVLRVVSEPLPTSGFPYRQDAATKWVFPAQIKPTDESPEQRLARRDDVLRSLGGVFALRRERRSGDPSEHVGGLRAPQVGAVHAVLAHWTVREDVATVVMPTGTGKTETMLALFVNERFERLLVVVPTDALRKQIAGKFAGLGLLKSLGVVTRDSQYPVVGIVENGFASVDAAEAFTMSCNVVVTTMRLLAAATPDIRAALAQRFSHVFIDEAHHVPAPTWENIRSAFIGCRIVQFTATPFRDDGKYVDGIVVYRYPLGRARTEGYFNPIRFTPVEALIPDLANQAIANKALAQLRDDLANGYDHLLMARAASIARAEEIHALYDELGSDMAPVLLHSELSAKVRTEALAMLERRQSRVVVCVDMLGEGVDLPALKVAALHDTHKSLTVTLQFIGRFARTGRRYGNATVVANILDRGFAKSLRALYAQDADWNTIIETLSEDATSRHAQRDAFAHQFEGNLSDLPLQNLYPKMSTLIFRTAAREWEPERAVEAFGEVEIIAGPLINAQSHTIVVATRHKDAVRWGDVRGLFDTTHHLHIAYWNPATRLFFVNTSDSTNFHGLLAKSVMGDDAHLVTGEQVFRALHGVNRLLLMNLGLKHTVNRRIQFNMMMGTDIASALSDAQQQNRIKWNLFGIGYEEGASTSVGCSQKGRIWSYKPATDVTDWIEWAQRVGRKINDPTITTATVLGGVIIPERAVVRPSSVPIAIEWGAEMLAREEDRVFIEIGGRKLPFYETDLVVDDFADTGPIRFAVASEGMRVGYAIQFSGTDVSFGSTSHDEAVVEVGRRRTVLSAFLRDNAPIVRFADGTFLQGSILCRPQQGPRRIYDRRKMIVWDWTGTDPHKESQTTAKHADSIQARLISELAAAALGLDYDLIFDDDAAGEAADVVAVKTEGRTLIIHLFHCKYTHGGFGAARIADLYEVCGQSQKSIRWRRNVEKLLDHLRYREGRRVASHGPSRFEKGSLRTLAALFAAAPESDVSFKIHIVQPGLSRARASDDQLELLASTESYLRETFDIDLAVLVSA